MHPPSAGRLAPLQQAGIVVAFLGDARGFIAGSVLVLAGVALVSSHGWLRQRGLSGRRRG